MAPAKYVDKVHVPGRYYITLVRWQFEGSGRGALGFTSQSPKRAQMEENSHYAHAHGRTREALLHLRVVRHTRARIHIDGHRLLYTVRTNGTAGRRGARTRNALPMLLSAPLLCYS